MSGDNVLERAESLITFACNAAREDEAVAFAEWKEENVFKKDNVYRLFDDLKLKIDTDKQLYQLFKKDTNG
jgi:hypothetical protein